MASTASSKAGFYTLQAGNCRSVKMWHLLATIVLYSYLCINFLKVVERTKVLVQVALKR